MRTTLSKRYSLALGMILVAITIILFPLNELTQTARAVNCGTAPGCQFSANVPCSNASCARFEVFPDQGATCSDGTIPK